MHGNLNHIGTFVHHVEQTYHKYYTVSNGWGDYVRPVAMLVLWRFAGITMGTVARYFKCDRTSVWHGISRQLGYEQTNDPKFIQHYNQLLELYISSTRFYIRKRKFIQ